ncbi:MAG: hypothetical protein FD143_2994 [Ignavibacteria bacterium]|nr:MAG: hypothetical protein FD143_2994 [Ignavibacteria bacterium]KAF0155156.1 MAG: hypothetical protein FD188_3191 [Ignavibacteria bacterium]
MESNFIDEMLLEIEEKEQQMELAHADMVLKEISSLQSCISIILEQAEEEKQIIHEWAIQRSAKLTERALLLTPKNSLETEFFAEGRK